MTMQAKDRYRPVLHDWITAHESRQAAADAYFAAARPGEDVSHEYRLGYFDAMIAAGVLIWISVSGEGLEREPGVLKP